MSTAEKIEAAKAIASRKRALLDRIESNRIDCSVAAVELFRLWDKPSRAAVTNFVVLLDDLELASMRLRIEAEKP